MVPVLNNIGTDVACVGVCEMSERMFRGLRADAWDRIMIWTLE
jgi:hypothetical protein